MTAVLAADIERATCGGRVHRAVGVDDKRATGVEYEWQSQPPRFTLVDPIEAAQRCFGSPRWAQCGLQTAPKFEFSLLHQAVQFELSRSFAAFALAAALGSWVLSCLWPGRSAASEIAWRASLRVTHINIATAAKLLLMAADAWTSMYAVTAQLGFGSSVAPSSASAQSRHGDRIFGHRCHHFVDLHRPVDSARIW